MQREQPRIWPIRENNQMKVLLGLFICAMLITSASISVAEVIFLKSGGHVEGKILKEDKKSVVVDAGIDMPVTYFKDEIKSIEKDFPFDPLASRHADELEAKAVELIDANQMSQGLDLMRQALILGPDAQRHMNYGSILFGNGVLLYKEDKKEQGRQILRQSEEELNKAIGAFDKSKDAFFMAQCFYLLGEMYANAFEDKGKAKDYYQEAVDLASHPGAQKALTKQ